MKKRGFLFYSLLGAIVLIWGKVIYGIATGLPHEEIRTTNTLQPPTQQPHNNKDGLPVTFDASTRDPFLVPDRLFRARRTSTKKLESPSVSHAEPASPPLSLMGVVDETAMLQGPNDLVVFARAGDNVFDMTITSIAPDSVTTRFEGRDITLTLK